jgi:hypothetical protein
MISFDRRKSIPVSSKSGNHLAEIDPEILLEGLNQ